MSVQSYVRLRCELTEGLERYGRWIGNPEVAPRALVRERDAIDLALADDQWRGLAVYVFDANPWTVFEELSGGLGDRDIVSWLALAKNDDLVFAAYNDAIGYAQLIVIEGGQVVREFFHDEQDADRRINVGRLPAETGKRMETWIDVARWVEEDERGLSRPTEGWLWIHQAPDDWPPVNS